MFINFDWASPNLKEFLLPMVTTVVVWYNYHGTHVAKWLKPNFDKLKCHNFFKLILKISISI